MFVRPEPNIFEATRVVATRLGLDRGDDCKVKTTEKTLNFQPGRHGIDFKHEQVPSVYEDSQGKRRNDGVEAH